MPTTTQPVTSETAPSYRYYVADLLTNKILAEIPFEDVSYERLLKSAGNFDGNIPVSEATNHLDLYNSTMPGKTALYVVRNSKPVWGGIIWQRTYDMNGRSLTVSASEFPSYLAHRTIWKTYSYSFSATLTKAAKNDDIKIVLDTKRLKKPLTLTDGAGNPTKVYVSFSEGEYVKYSGYYSVIGTGAKAPTTKQFYIQIPKLPARPNANYSGVTISTKVDTYQYLKEMFADLLVDFKNTTFSNEILAPGKKVPFTVTYKFLNASTRTATLTTESEHGIVVGQVVEVLNVDTQLNGTHTVTDVPSATTFTYIVPATDDDGDAISYTNISPAVAVVSKQILVESRQLTTTTRKSIDKYSRTAARIATITTVYAHGFKVNDNVLITMPADVTFEDNKLSVKVLSVTNKGKTFTYQQADTTVKAVATTTVKESERSKNGAVLAVERIQARVYTKAATTFEKGDNIYIGGVDEVDWGTPIYNGYHLVDEVDDTLTAGDSAAAWFGFTPEYGSTREPDNSVTVSGRAYTAYKSSSAKGKNTVTLITSKRHGCGVGDTIKVDLAKGGAFNGTFKVKSIPDYDKLTYSIGATDSPPSDDINYDTISGSVERVRTRVGDLPVVSMPITRVRRKDNRAYVVSDDHEFSVGDSITVEMDSLTAFDTSTPKKVLDVTKDTFSYANVGTDTSGTTAYTITHKELVANVGTCYTSVTHALAIGEVVVISGLTDSYTGKDKFSWNGSVTVTKVTSKTFSFVKKEKSVEKVKNSGTVTSKFTAGTGTAYINISPKGDAQTIEGATRASNVATITSTNHGFVAGQWVVVWLYGKASAQKAFNNSNAAVKITSATDNTFTYANTGANYTDSSPAGVVTPAPTIEKKPTVFTRTYGEFPENSNMGGISFEDSNYSNKQYPNSLIRGSDLVNVGAHIDSYSTSINGFQYRIDVSYAYDSSGARYFKKTFVLVPNYPKYLESYLNVYPLEVGQAAPPFAFKNTPTSQGADSLVFEYPGNVSNVNMSEDASNAATRVFVVGNNSDLGANAGSRYAAASDTDLLNKGWPLLDRGEKQEWPLVGFNVINVDNYGNYDAEEDFFKTAQRYLYESKPPAGNYVITVNGSMNPLVGSYDPGDWCTIVINDDFAKKRLASNLEPRTDRILRKIDGIKVQVPNSPAFPEQIDLTLVTDWQVDQIGK